MTRTARQAWLSFVALLCVVLLVPAFARKKTERTLAARPADWLLASEIVDGALDRDSPRRFDLWRAAYAHARLLAPHRQNANAAFVRAGLFHWYELGEEDRARVLAAAAPLMRDPGFFARMHMPMLQLTRDFTWIRRHAPPALGTRESLRKLAINRGLFHDYRVLSEEIRQSRLQAFAARRRTDDPAALLGLLPDRLDAQDRPLVQGILEELDRLAFDPSKIPSRVDDVVTFALDHDLKPLTGVTALLEVPSPLRDVTRARVALALERASVASRIELTSNTVNAAEWQPYYLQRARYEAMRGDAATANTYLVRAAADNMNVPVLAAAADVARILRRDADHARYVQQLARTPRPWQGLCGENEICSSARKQEWAAERTTQKITLSNTQSDETPPYVEIYVHGFRIAQGEVRDARTFTIPIPQGAHEVEIRLVNTHTRNGVQRRVRLS